MPVVCVRLSETVLAAAEAKALRKGQDRSAWLRSLVLKDLGLGGESTEVEALVPTPPSSIDPLVPGDTITLLEPPDPSLPAGAIRP